MTKLLLPALALLLCAGTGFAADAAKECPKDAKDCPKSECPKDAKDCPKGDKAKAECDKAKGKDCCPKDAKKGHDIDAKALKAAIDAKTATLIDCNGSARFAKGRLPGAIDFEASKAKLAELLPKDKTALVVAYCGGPKCMAYKDGVKAAKELGYTNVKHFSGGLSGWTEAGLALEK